MCAYRVVVVNPEQAFKVKGGFAKIWRKKEFTARLISVVWDEAHCVFSWASFRTDYADAGRMRNLLSAPFLMPSATMPDPVLNGVLDTLHLQRARVEIHRRSNDRPNVYLTVRKIQHALGSFQDLVDVLLGKGWKRGDGLPFKSLTFFDNIEESIQAADVLRKHFPPEDRFKLLCFNSDVTATLREAATNEFRDGKLWGLYCTDSFGMVRPRLN